MPTVKNAGLKRSRDVGKFCFGKRRKIRGLNGENHFFDFPWGGAEGLAHEYLARHLASWPGHGRATSSFESCLATIGCVAWTAGGLRGVDQKAAAAG